MLDSTPKFKTTLLALEEKKQEVELKWAKNTMTT
jgi:hypothetical protein